MTIDEVTSVKAAALDEINTAGSADEVETLRIKYMGRNGLIPKMMQGLKDVPASEKPAMGAALNSLRENVSTAISSKKTSLATSKKDSGAFDFSLPGNWHRRGVMHPISTVIEEAVRIFGQMGFTVADGPDIETEFNNFDALNTAKHHPSRDAGDTFWFEDGRLLRTQTSPVQIRVMQSKKPPVRIINPGRCYRRDTTDATHAANFHQIEGLYVDYTPVSLADLKSTLAHFAHEMMGADVKVRFRPHYFPFTEPSVEVDFSCHVCKGSGCRVCKQSGWIEIAGAGMVDPRVYKKIGYDEELYGYAFGMGVERIAMIRYGISDLRFLYTNDMRFLNQFA
jgi:phenylalanyl-tRNA synthetase alpha chain